MIKHLSRALVLLLLMAASGLWLHNQRLNKQLAASQQQLKHQQQHLKHQQQQLATLQHTLKQQQRLQQQQRQAQQQLGHERNAAQRLAAQRLQQLNEVLRHEPTVTPWADRPLPAAVTRLRRTTASDYHHYRQSLPQRQPVPVITGEPRP